MGVHFNSEDPLHIVAIILLVWYGLKLFIFTASLLFKPCFALDISKKFGGKWALVTGATDGIGKEYARQLARKGLNIVLVSRSQDKLTNVSKTLKDECPQSKVTTIAVDFVKDDVNEYKSKILQGIKGLEIGVLVNNVGMSQQPGRYLEIGGMPDILAQDIINCNITSINVLTALVLPQMVEQRSGLIINLSSIAAVLLPPFLAVYSATKAYDDAFSEILRQEYQEYNITVQSVMPGMVVSNMSKVKESFTAPSAEKFVSSALSRVGVYNRTHGYWVHSLTVSWVNMWPIWMKEYFLNQAMAEFTKAK